MHGHGHFWTGGWGAGLGRGLRHPRRFKRGILKYVVLKLLAEQPRHGYELIQIFRRRGWGGFPGSIYPLLASLEADGFIAGRDEGDRRTYELTETGRRHFEEAAGHVGEFFEDEAEPDAAGDLREAAGRLMQAIQLGSGSKPETVGQMRDLVDRTRKEIYALLAQE